MQRPFFPALVITLALLTGVTVWTNYQADPYALFRNPSTHDGRDNRDLFFNLRLHKPYAMTEIKPRALLLGSSTLGPFRPGSVFGETLPAYNASLPGATLLEMRRTLEHAQSLAPVQSVVIGLEFYQFRASKRPTMPGFADRRLLRPPATHEIGLGVLWQRFLDYWAALYSRGAIQEARLQRNSSSRSNRQFYTDGSWQNIDSDIGSRWLFNLIAVQKYAEFSELDNLLDFTALGKLLDTAESGNANALVILSPLHAYTLSAIEMAGGLEAYLLWFSEVAHYLHQRGVDVISLPPGAGSQTHAVAEPSGLFVDGIHYSETGAEALGACLNRFLRGLPCQGVTRYQALHEDDIDHHVNALTTLVDSYPGQSSEDYLKLRKLIASQRELQDQGVDIVQRYL